MEVEIRMVTRIRPKIEAQKEFSKKKKELLLLIGTSK